MMYKYMSVVRTRIRNVYVYMHTSEVRIYRCICIHIYMYISTYMHIYMYVYIYVCIHTHTHTQTHTCMHKCMHTYSYMYVHRYIQNFAIYVCAHTNTLRVLLGHGTLELIMFFFGVYTQDMICGRWWQADHFFDFFLAYISRTQYCGR